MNIKNKNIVITGGSSGFGLGLAKIFYAMGGKIWIVSRNANKLKDVSDYFYGDIRVSQCNMQVQLEVDALFDKLYTKDSGWSGKVDIFIANAGFGYYEKFDAPSWSHIEDIYSLNVISPIYTLGKAIKYSGGRTFQYVFISSGVAKFPMPGFSIYSSTKSAIDGFIKAYGWEKNSNIILTGVYPVAVKTGFFEKGESKANIPLIRQDYDKCVISMANGIIQNKRTVYTSSLLKTAIFFSKFAPIEAPVMLAEKMRLISWAKK